MDVAETIVCVDCGGVGPPPLVSPSRGLGAWRRGRLPLRGLPRPLGHGPRRGRVRPQHVGCVTTPDGPPAREVSSRPVGPPRKCRAVAPVDEDGRTAHPDGPPWRSHVGAPAPVAGRRLPSLGVVLADGSWLRAWPLAGVLAPLVAVVAGALAGALRPDPAYEVGGRRPSRRALAVLVIVAGCRRRARSVGADRLHRRRPGLHTTGGPPRPRPRASVWDRSVPGSSPCSCWPSSWPCCRWPPPACGPRSCPACGVRASWPGPRARSLQGALFGAGVALWTHAAAVLLRTPPDQSATVLPVDSPGPHVTTPFCSASSPVS